MAERRTLARPYANAVFALAREKKSLDNWSAMLGLMATVVSDEGVKNLAANPRVSKDAITDLIKDVCAKGIDDDGLNLVRLLLENQRLQLLPEIAEIFDEYKDEADGRMEAVVTSAYELDGKQIQAIGKALKKKLGRDIDVVTEIDKNLIGGLVIRAGDTVIDGSVTGYLQDLSLQLGY